MLIAFIVYIETRSLGICVGNCARTLEPNFLPSLLNETNTKRFNTLRLYLLRYFFTNFPHEIIDSTSITETPKVVLSI